jgi:hypothetical protein
MIDEGCDDEGGSEVVSILALLTMWEPAPESAYHSPVPGGESVMVLKLLASEDVSKLLTCMGVHGCYC